MANVLEMVLPLKEITSPGMYEGMVLVISTVCGFVEESVTNISLMLAALTV
jgi:hypothetical protein